MSEVLRREVLRRFEMNAMNGLALSQRRRSADRPMGGFSDGFRAALAIAGLMLACAARPCEAQCVEQGERVPASILKVFQIEPTSLLRDPTVRGDRNKLTGRLAAYVVSDITILPAVRDLVSESSNVERNAIGMALRRAQLICVPRKPETAQKISQFIQKLADSAVSAGYSAELEAVEFNPNAVASPSAGGTPGSSPQKPSSSANSLMTGEWSTDVGDPFAPAPLPQ
ncbi:hypothetical protein JQ612_20590 [Bradyrhizobium manausense]|uniref:hypothetical protein n=1 Tax=Bradyrhizobium manausense TaxID=989370 RepID=UPI001BA8BA52|nr:hypothetical protein [Bradyrhizobium manausense]MBR0724754.1 hypothetical protein [Bradyrhizobium manausense]MBR0835592.1 hypothetical protein [Bradyrhizobium manausense]